MTGRGAQNDGVPDAFYLPTDDATVFQATASTQGPWDPDTQHAGPPSALVTRAVEHLPSSIPGPSQLVRLTMEVLGPVRIGEVRVTATVARPGRTVELVEAELESAGRVAIRCRAWRIRTADVALPPHAIPPVSTVPPPPTDDALGARILSSGYGSAVDFRPTSGTFDGPGPAAAWTRVLVPLIEGEAISPTQRLMAVADSGNGISRMVDVDKWWFINTDLSVHLHRVPVGDWIHMDSLSTLDPTGVGLAETVLHDATGRVGRGAQALMVGLR
jgi:hypothetical protein